MKPRVMLDATPMLDTSGQRGIGRFLYDLMRGLGELKGEWHDDLSIEVVTDLGWHGDATSTDDLVRAAETTRAARGSQIDRIAPKRRVSLGVFARHASLLHLPEARGTPLVAHRCTVVTCHDFIPLRFPEQYLGGSRWTVTKRRMAEKRRYSRATRVVAISRKTRDDAIDLLGIDADRIDVVPNGIDLAAWTPAKDEGDDARLRALGLGARPFVVYVGYCDARKSIEAMLSTVARTPNVDLAWAGELLPDDVTRLRAHAARERIGERLHLLGFVDDATLASLYRGAAAHLFLSRLEGFGLSVVEAMACGCPPIVVASSGVDEIVADAGVVVAPNDVAAASAAITKLLENKAFRDDMQRRGSDRARAFGRETMARGYLEVWRRVLGLRPAACTAPASAR